MPQAVPSLENHFIAGLKTEFTGLNFPENAATDTSNCVYSLIGDVSRRGGINYETNFQTNNINQNSVAKSSFRWLNAGGDGQTQLLVQQIGNTLNFFKTSLATVSAPASTTLIASTVNILQFAAVGNVADPSQTECQYTSGNGYLFVFHPNLDPFYCTFSGNVVSPNVITLQIRDYVGIFEPGVADNLRPNSLSAEHNYNLVNQGWTSGTPWIGTTINYFGLGSGAPVWPSAGQSVTLTIASQTNTTSVINGSTVQITGIGQFQNGTLHNQSFIGTVTSYSTPFTSITILATTSSQNPGIVMGGGAGGFPDTISLINLGFIQTWNTQVGNFPSNSDIWWLYKNTSQVFAPSTTVSNVQQSFTSAPKGYFLMNAFSQDRSKLSGIAGLTPVTTTKRPSTGVFYQGRVFYAGVNDSFPPTGDEPFYTWSENIYFSQIVTNTQTFGKCYQQNDPTSQITFNTLATDGGVISIPGCGAIYKLISLRYGLLVFAANGIWFISGGQTSGFTATDISVNRISNIQAISGTSFIDVQGYPMFWNQEGIYYVTPTASSGSAHSPDIQLDVQNITLGSILSFYDNIPLASKSFARGDYDGLSYIVQWCFRSTSESGIGNRYNYDSILSYNVVTKAFYPYSLPSGSASSINDVKYIQNPGSPTTPLPIFKYITSVGNNITLSEENDFTRFVDFFSENNAGYDFTSFFVTGYRLPGQGLRKLQVPYIYIFSRNPAGIAYGVRAVWDYAGDGLSGKFSTRQVIQNSQTDFSNLYRKIRLRGRGIAVQIKVDSVSGHPFDLLGWSILNEVNPNI